MSFRRISPRRSSVDSQNGGYLTIKSNLATAALISIANNRKKGACRTRLIPTKGKGTHTTHSDKLAATSTCCGISRYVNMESSYDIPKRKLETWHSKSTWHQN